MRTSTARREFTGSAWLLDDMRKRSVCRVPLFAHRAGVVPPGRMDGLLAGALPVLCAGMARFEEVDVACAPYAWTAPVFFALILPVLRVRPNSRFRRGKLRKSEAASKEA